MPHVLDRGKKLGSFATGNSTLSSGFQPAGTDMALLPAACYKVYMGLRGRRLDEPLVVGCMARCFRHEDKVLDAYRALNFTMKEFVCLGNVRDAQRHIEDGFLHIDRLMDHLGIRFSCEVASDPFFDASGSLATLSRLSPTKREIVFQGHAVASMNFHRNYFGDKFDIRIADQPVNTSCVAFGIERWISMFKDVFKTPHDAIAALASAEPALAFRAPAEVTSALL